MEHANHIMPINDFPGYFVSRNGVVLSTWSRGANSKQGTCIRQLRPSYAGRGYLKVALCRNHVAVTKYVHDLVAIAFIGSKPEGMQVRHLDGNKDNNAAHNLAYGTPAENAADSVRLGKTTRGERNPMSKLSVSSVRRIRQLIASGRTQKRIADQFGIRNSSVSNIRTRKTWAHVA